MYKEPVHRVPRELRTDGWIEVVSRAGAGGVPSLDHPESHSCVESRTRHEIFVFGFDYTQKIGVQGGHAPHPHPVRGAGPSNSSRLAWIDGWIEVVSRAGAGGVPSLDHPESHSCVESRTRHEIFV